MIAFVDLDDSLFQTAAKVRSGSHLTLRAVDRAGAPLSYSTPAQEALLSWLQQAGTIVPVTGRTDDALERVLLPFSSYRITHHGAMLRGPDRQPTAAWQDRIRPQLEVAQGALAAVAAALEARIAEWRARLTTHHAEGLVTYLSVKMEASDSPFPVAEWEEALGPFARDVGPCQWLVHGRQAAVMPQRVGKREAVTIVQEELLAQAPHLFLGLGDSLSDGPFLRTCDFCLTPAGSEIAALFGGK